MSEPYCGQDHEHQAFVAFDICGCVGGISVLTHFEADAYVFAGKEVKAGLRVELLPVETVRTMQWTCADHPKKGPPWWRSNGGRAKDRPASWPQPKQEMLVMP